MLTIAIHLFGKFSFLWDWLREINEPERIQQSFQCNSDRGNKLASPYEKHTYSPGTRQGFWLDVTAIVIHKEEMKTN
ncbi:hypothetical protein TNCV_134351 [Trichonephila clavipes]|nr:hypothetical protein TNCV_134351 [Trichonephila clavipes]